MAAGRPARAAFDVSGMRNFADVEIARGHSRPLALQVAFQAKVVVAFDEELPIDRAVREMATGAALATRFMFENKRAALFAMTLRASLVESRHRKSAGRLHDVMAVRIVAIHAVHLFF